MCELSDSVGNSPLGSLEPESHSGWSQSTHWGWESQWRLEMLLSWGATSQVPVFFVLFQWALALCYLGTQLRADALTYQSPPEAWLRVALWLASYLASIALFQFTQNGFRVTQAFQVHYVPNSLHKK